MYNMYDEFERVNESLAEVLEFQWNSRNLKTLAAKSRDIGIKHEFRAGELRDAASKAKGPNARTSRTISAEAHDDEAKRKHQTADWLTNRANRAFERETDEARQGVRTVVRRMR
jgi:hypothetical protein